jgi:hypothetical protein
MMLWIVSVNAFNRATGAHVQGRYAVCAASREEAIDWVVKMFEQTDVQFEVDAHPHANEVLVLELKQVGRAVGTRSALHMTR